MLELVDQPRHTSTSPLLGERAGDARARTDRRLFARRDAGDPRVRNELIERFLPLARSLARRYERSGEPLEDLVQVASLALVKAIDGYDGTRGVPFSSYAVPTIVGELKRHFRDRTWAVRPPRHLQELTLRLDRAAESLSAQLDRTPTVAELAAAVAATDEDVLEALRARGAHRGLSLHAPTGGQENQTVLQDTLGASDDGYAHAEARVLLDALLAGLPARSREVLRLRFEQDLTQVEIGELLGVSQMQISRIIRQAIDQVRQVAEQQERMADERVMGESTFELGPRNVGVTTRERQGTPGSC
jgi:RNA polymerase sigma-B factor